MAAHRAREVLCRCRGPLSPYLSTSSVADSLSHLVNNRRIREMAADELQISREEMPGDSHLFAEDALLFYWAVWPSRQAAGQRNSRLLWAMHSPARISIAI